MSKVGGAIPAWYWPEGIPRRSPVPQQTLDRLIKRVCRKAEKPAIIWPDRAITCAELLETITVLGQAVFAMLPDDEVVAITERDPGEALVLALGVMQAGKRALLADLDAGDDRLAAQLAETGAGVALATTESVTLPGVRKITRAELEAFDGDAPKLRPVKATAPALIIPDGDELAVHSNYSLAAMAVSLNAFIPEMKTMSAAAVSPLWHWESLTAVLCALVSGASVFVAPLDEIAAIDGFDPDQTYLIILPGDADAFAENAAIPPVLAKLRYVFVSTGYFRTRWRRSLESRLGTEVLLLWGRGAFGPAVAAHPTWFPFEAHGIPLVNVRVLPVDPNSGKPSLVPWEMLESAEIGVESPAQMTGFVRPDATAELMTGKIMRTHVAASVDHVGIVALHKPPRRKANVR